MKIKPPNTANHSPYELIPHCVPKSAPDFLLDVPRKSYADIYVTTMHLYFLIQKHFKGHEKYPVRPKSLITS